MNDKPVFKIESRGSEGFGTTAPIQEWTVIGYVTTRALAEHFRFSSRHRVTEIGSLELRIPHRPQDTSLLPAGSMISKG